jgi:septal ring factor EnvC (AmiA/AmiB activator)
MPNGTQRRTTIMLGVLVAVLVAAVGVFLTLFLMERGAVSDAEGQVSVTEKQIADEKDQLADTKSTADELAQQGQDLQTTNEQLQGCADASKKTIQVASTNGSDADLNAAIDEMLIACVRQGEG